VIPVSQLVIELPVLIVMTTWPVVVTRRSVLQGTMVLPEVSTMKREMNWLVVTSKFIKLVSREQTIHVPRPPL
jgi:hypothetical protein